MPFVRMFYSTPSSFLSGSKKKEREERMNTVAGEGEKSEILGCPAEGGPSEGGGPAEGLAFLGFGV